MKNKLLFIAAWLVILIVTSCGPSAEEFEKRKIDERAADKSKSASMEEEGTKNNESSFKSNEKPSLVKDITVNFSSPEDRKVLKNFSTKFKVNNVKSATEKIEDLTKKYGGYITFSDLKNTVNDVVRTAISRDSILKLTEYIVINDITLRVPNARVDSFIRELNPIINFLDNRLISLRDVTVQYLANNKKAERLENYNSRQIKHIEAKESKLKDVTTAENNLLEHQMQSDELLYKNLEMEDRLKYCDIAISIYQKPVLQKEIIVDLDYLAAYKPNFFSRAWDSIVSGFIILEETVIVLLKLWGIVLIGFAMYKLIRFIIRLFSKK